MGKENSESPIKTNFRQLYLGLQFAITGRFAQRMHFNSWNFGHTSGSGGSGALFWATAHAADAIAHEMKNAVHGIRAVGEARIAGPQARSVNTLSIAASRPPGHTSKDPRHHDERASTRPGARHVD